MLAGQTYRITLNIITSQVAYFNPLSLSPLVQYGYLIFQSPVLNQRAIIHNAVIFGVDIPKSHVPHVLYWNIVYYGVTASEDKLKILRQTPQGSQQEG